MANILITGGAGFIGSHTAEALVAAGHQVRVLDALDVQIHGPRGVFPAHLHPAVERLRGDVRDREDVARALKGVDVVYHFAALTGVGQSMYSLRAYVDTNCTGTANLLEGILARTRPLQRFILSSSRAVYGEGTHQCVEHGEVFPEARKREDLERGVFDARCPHCGRQAVAVATAEDRPLKPISLYAWTKLQQEELCRHAAQTFGLPVTILRYFNVYGSRQSVRNPYTGVASVFYSRLAAGQPISLYEHGQAGRDFVHVSDVARANLLALTAEVQHGMAVNIGLGAPTDIRGVARALARACRRPLDAHATAEFRIGDIAACFADLSRARRVLGYRPRVGLPEGLAEFVAWARGQESIDLYRESVAELAHHGLFGCGVPLAESATSGG